MFNKFILSLAPNSKRHIAIAVVCNVLLLFLNITITALFIYALYAFIEDARFNIPLGLITATGLFMLRFGLVRLIHRHTYLATGSMKKAIRTLILAKNVANQKNRRGALNTAELTQLALEGVEQTENYISVFLPQFFYALISVVVVFTILMFISVKTALVLLVAIPLIPVSVLAIVKFAKRLFAKYWGNYTNLGADFLDYTSGMTTLKIHTADEDVASEISGSAEKFRKITMRVLSMQLNSITVMDAIAFGGAALAIVMGLTELISGTINMYEMLFITLLSADFFLPLRALGSAFHIAMNGISAAKKIEMYLNETTDNLDGVTSEDVTTVSFSDVTFYYEAQKAILTNFNMHIKKGDFVALVGDSGSGKSTIATLLTGYAQVLSGEILINDININDYNFFNLNTLIRRVSYDSHIFKGTIRSNLQIAKTDATDEEMESALIKAELFSFVEEVGGLDYLVSEGGQNLSGGERQRLALARIFLVDAKLYIFDEALSSIDGLSEAEIMHHIYKLKAHAAVLFITHRLDVIKNADNIILLSNGQSESGTHSALLNEAGMYRKMFKAQQEMLSEGQE